VSEDILRGGDLLGDRYRLIDRIGAGGMSVIWRAKDETLDRLVAVKVLDPQLAGDERLRELARREAWAAARLNHPDVASVHDFVRFRRGGREVAIIVLQLVAGEPLADRIAMGPLPWPEALRIAARIATVLSVAHRLGVVHRDITPDNIMVHGGKITVLDFGIAARIGEADDDSTGATFGTPAYVAPERLDGLPAQAATDIYALGVVLHEMLTGAVPFRVHGWEEVATDHGKPPAVSVPGLPRSVPEIIGRCLQREPRARPTAAEVALVVQRASAARPGRWWRRGAIAVTVSVVAAVAATPWFLSSPGTPTSEPTHTPAYSPTTPATVTPPPTPSPSPFPSASRTHTAPGSPGAMPSRSPVVVPVPTAPTVDEALAAALAAVDEEHSSGELRDDVALDLRQVIQNLAYNADTRSEIDTTTDGVLTKIDDRVREGSLRPACAEELKVDVRELAAALIRAL
jgi:serine/threonine protein kinase